MYNFKKIYYILGTHVVMCKYAPLPLYYKNYMLMGHAKEKITLYQDNPNSKKNTPNYLPANYPQWLLCVYITEKNINSWKWNAKESLYVTKDLAVGSISWRIHHYKETIVSEKHKNCYQEVFTGYQQSTFCSSEKTSSFICFVWKKHSSSTFYHKGVPVKCVTSWPFLSVVQSIC